MTVRVDAREPQFQDYAAIYGNQQDADYAAIYGNQQDVGLGELTGSRLNAEACS
jgi:hypothetical protein